MFIPRPSTPVPILSSQMEETGYFEWFKCRTSPKLPGGFISSFWSILLLQASLSEPAVLHAVLALSSVHRRGINKAHMKMETNKILDEGERFSLQHYVKAITHLQPHFLTKDRASLRVALITCIVFVCVDYLRGHFKTAQTHLQNGLKVLVERQMLSNGHDRAYRSGPCHDSTDIWIAEAFSRLHLQVELFKHSPRPLGLVIEAAQPVIPRLVFQSTNEIWQDLERLLNEIFHLTHRNRQQAASECDSLRHSPALLGDRQRIQAELVWWLDMYEAFKQNPRGHSKSAEEEKHYQLLGAYHTMATIMADTSLRLNDESVFESNTNQFVWLVRQLTNLWINASMTSPIDAMPGRALDMSRSIIDMGWIPPLFYAATKCRIHRVRLQAIRLLESTFHREGIWDSRIAACVARKVMMAEELDFYKDIDTADDFPLLSFPRPKDLLLPALPEAYRIREVEVVLSDPPMDKILLFCSRNEGGMVRRVLLSEYDAHLQHWIDGESS